MTVPQQTILALENVTKRYGKTTALNDVSLCVGSGITGLLGPNGSGKSTMIKALLGLLKIQRGRVCVLGFDLVRDMRAIRDHVGYLPEDDCYIAGLSGIESVCFMARLSGLPATEALRRAHESIDFADIGQERYRSVETYSTGMRQKLKFAQAIVHDPQLLILDEPTTGLDPQQRVALLGKIRHLAVDHGKSIMISTHILHDVQSICDSVVIMAKGRIKLVDSLENLRRPARAGMLVRLGDAASGALPTNAAAEILAQQLRADEREVDLRADGSLWIHEMDAGDCRPVWQAARQCGVSIRQLSAARNSLEEVFMHAVREAHDAPA